MVISDATTVIGEVAILCNYSPIPPLSPLPKNLGNGERGCKKKESAGKPPADSFFPGYSVPKDTQAG
ncbi:MAG: hypothetical protein A2Z71_02420 [Chloroflexi bacterium RBG_13_50_21]|nr:MAG: hypothetical protein A2Z71_02420 [Chloroflexi bacterium RBG_13_50_21]